ncbi:MAG: hypothetical protein OXQ94_08670 [Gemmatimonadota bacterium]|nr:hypothetical protein [Gemmatimonadota bacterium]
MFGDLFSWYVTSLAEFWGSAIRIGLPQILLVILLICWLRRQRCGRSRGSACCRIWSCGRCGDKGDWTCCEASAGYTCGRRSRRGDDHAREVDEDAEGE